MASTVLYGTSPSGSRLPLSCGHDGVLTLSAPGGGGVNDPISTDTSALLARTFPIDTVITSGEFQGVEYARRLGRNTDIDTNSVPETIWPGGGEYTGFPLSGFGTVEVFSSDADDTDTGAGARTVMLSGLDENFLPQQETVTLRGTTPVVTTNTWSRIYRASVMSVGSSAHNEGTITARLVASPAVVFAIIAPTENQTTQAVYTIPDGKEGFLQTFAALVRNPGNAAVGGNVSARMSPTEPFRPVLLWNVRGSGGNFVRENIRGIYFPPRSDIKVEVTELSGNNTDMTNDFLLLLKDIA